MVAGGGGQVEGDLRLGGVLVDAGLGVADVGACDLSGLFEGVDLVA